VAEPIDLELNVRLTNDVYPVVQSSGIDLGALAQAIAPLVIDEIQGRLHPEVQGLLEGMREKPGLDTVCCSILADWLEENSDPTLATRVRKLPVRDGDLVIVRAVGRRREVREAGVVVVAEMNAAFDRMGIKAAAVYIPDYLDVTHYRTGSKSAADVVPCDHTATEEKGRDA